MSKSLLAKPKSTLGFAGVIVAFALVVVFLASRFLPFINPEPAAPQVVELNEESAAPVAQPTPQVTWADDSGLTDDWNVAPANQSQSSSDQAADSDSPDADQDVFSDFSPEASPAPARPSTRGSNSGPTITTRAAPGAPEPVPPPR